MTKKNNPNCCDTIKSKYYFGFAKTVYSSITRIGVKCIYTISMQLAYNAL